MPKRTDLQSILILGSGPSSSADGRVRLQRHAGPSRLGEEVYRVILANSNPGKIMTDAPRWRPFELRLSSCR